VSNGLACYGYARLGQDRHGEERQGNVGSEAEAKTCKNLQSD